MRNFDYNLNLWFENVAQFVQEFPVNFSFNLLSLRHFAMWEILKWVILSYYLVKKIFCTLLAIFISNIVGNKSGSILEYKGSVRHVQKGHFTLVTQVNVFLPDWQKFKALVTISLNRFSSCTHTPLWYIAVLTISHFLT